MMEGKFIFIIDDDNVQNEIYSILLKKVEPEAKVLTFTTTKDAIKAIENKLIPEIIFLDLNIPGETSRLFLEAHRQLGLLSDIYLMSSYAHLEDQGLLNEFRMVKDFISKPLLAHKIRYVLSQYA